MNEKMVSVFIKPPRLETERLILRKMVTADYKDMFAYSSLPETSKYLLWYPHTAPTFTKRYLSYVQGQYRSGNFYDFALEEKSSGRMIGTCGFTSFDFDHNGAEVGYVLHPECWGKGLAAEALTRLMRFGFSELHLHRLTAKIIAENRGSMRVAEKCGFRHEATHIKAMLIKDEYRTIAEYAILAEEYFDKHGHL